MRATLVLDITYDDATTDKKYVMDQLDLAVSHLVNNGLLSGNGPAVIDEYHYHVEIEH